jgi:hypothetical protein
MGQKSPIEVQNVQETTELTGDLRKRAVLKMCHSFLQWSGSLRGHLVSEKGDLVCSKVALRRADWDPVRLKLVEDSP